MLFSRLRIKFWQQCGQNNVKSQIFFLSTLSPITINETCFLETIVIFSKRALVQVECSPDERAEIFHQNTDNLLCKVRILLKTVTLSSRNPSFYQIFVCTRQMHFWRLCRNFWAKYGKISYWNPEIDDKSQNCWKKILKWSSRIRKRSPVNSEQTRLFRVKLISTLSFKKHMKNLVLSRSCFSSKWSSGQVRGSSDNCDEFLHQKSDSFLCKVQTFMKNCYSFQAKTNSSSNVRPYT